MNSFFIKSRFNFLQNSLQNWRNFDVISVLSASFFHRRGSIFLGKTCISCKTASSNSKLVFDIQFHVVFFKFLFGFHQNSLRFSWDPVSDCDRWMSEWMWWMNDMWSVDDMWSLDEWVTCHQWMSECMWWVNDMWSINDMWSLDEWMTCDQWMSEWMWWVNDMSSVNDMWWVNEWHVMSEWNVL